ncbi:MAG: polysaccharide biosynthesis tyrosine autokinase [Scytonematopsis contorta HA4267-MV1]|jgi:capsular exopolysaccharide synthesis family protein|nr:polysaccharide biosynthesis tyrosine autokinase [Scytonematopsis contorta HA4267-MV1]
MSSNQEDQNNIDLQQYWLILKKRWLVIVSVAGSVLGLTAIVPFYQKPVYEAEGKLLFNKTDRATSLTGLSEQMGEINSVNQGSNPLDTEAEVIRSYPIVSKTISNLQLMDKQGNPLEIDDFLRKLKVKSIRGTDILSLSYRSTNRQEAADVVNLLIRYYRENNVGGNRVEATAAREFLRKQLPDVESRVIQAEVALRRFKEANRIVVLDEEAKAGVVSLKELSQQIITVQAQLTDAQTRSRTLKEQLKMTTQQAVDFSTLSQTDGVQDVLVEYQKTQKELAVQQTRLTPEHPTIQNLSSKKEALKKQLEARVGENLGNGQPIPQRNLQIGELKESLTAKLVQSDSESLALANQVQVLKNAYSNYQNRLSVLPQLEQKQRVLERQLQVARSTYEQLLKRLQEVDVVVNQNVGNARIVSEAVVAKKPVSPKMELYLAIGGCLGILLGVGTSLFLEAMDKSLKTVEEAEQILGYPLQGVIPRLSYKGGVNTAEYAFNLPVRDNPHSPASAAFEMLQANLDFSVSDSDKQLKVIVVLSSSPSEGRSFVAANLAVAKAHMGRRVLLIDGDMRHPCQHAIWKIPNSTGLSNILVGQTELQPSTQEVLINVEVLTAGTIPPNPAALLDSQKMAALIAEAARDYDVVIIDTPALNLFADGLMLGKLADGILLVVRPGVLDLSVAKATKAKLEQSRSRVLGMVINGVTYTTKHGNYYTNKQYPAKNVVERKQKAEGRREQKETEGRKN